MSRRADHVDATVLERWAAGRPTPHALSELIGRLLQSEPTVTNLLSLGRGITLDSDWNLMAVAEAGSQWVPEGASGWIVSTAVYSGRKALADLDRVLAFPSPLDPKAGSFVFVTLRRWAGKWDWLAEARKSDHWKGIRVYDADDLAAWLAETPDVALWFAATQLHESAAFARWAEPRIAWDPDALRLEAGPLAWLRWSARSSRMAGRQTEMTQLLQWARRGEGVRFRVLAGEGGTGKTRLVHEVAEQLQGEGWGAGAVSLGEPLPFGAGQFGCFLILDRPEEHQAAVLERLRELAQLRDVPGRGVRVLLVTRLADCCESLIDEAGASQRRDLPLTLAEEIEPDAAWALFHDVQNRIPRAVGTREPDAPSRQDFADWLARNPVNRRALAIMAAAVLSVLQPDRPALALPGAEAMMALADWERARLQGLAVEHGFEERALERLSALATVSGGLSTATIGKLASSELRMGLGSAQGLMGRLERVGCLKNSVFPPPEPRIVAAGFVVRVLVDCGDIAAEWLWAVMEGAETDALARLNRLICDAEVVLGQPANRLSRRLADMVRGRPERADRFAGEVLGDIPIGLLPLSAAVWATLAEHADNFDDRSNHLNNLSIDLSAMGDADGALAAIRTSVEILRDLARFNPVEFESLLPNRLNTLSVCLATTGDNAGALQAVREAVNVLRRLTASDTQAFEVDLAYSLNTLSNRFADSGDAEGALAAIREAVEVRRRLAAASPVEYEPDLALSLTNLSSRLLSVGDGDGARAAATEAVEIRRRLATVNKAAYGADLASSLNHLSNCLSDAGDMTGAAAAVREALDILRPLAEVDPARSRLNFALGLNRLSICLAATGDRAGALSVAEEAERVSRELASSSPARYTPLLASVLGNLSKRLSDAGDPVRAIRTIRETVAIQQRLAEDNPSRFQAEWAMGLATMAGLQGEQGRSRQARASLEKAIELVRPTAVAHPNSPAGRALGEMQKQQERLLQADPSQGGRVLGVEELLELAFFLVLDGWAAPSFLVAPPTKALVRALDQRRKENGPVAPSDLLDALRRLHDGAVPDPLWQAWTLETQIGSLRAMRIELFGVDRVREADRAARAPEAGTSLDQTARRRPKR